MKTVLTNQPAEENGHHKYDPAQFGLAATEVDSCFSAYCERFGLGVQTATVGTGVIRSAAAN
jgi:hypothetical protein